MSSIEKSSGFTPSLPTLIREPGIYEIEKFEDVLSGFVPNTLGLFDADECSLKNQFSFSSYVGLMDRKWRVDFAEMCQELEPECFLISMKLNNRDVFNALVDYITMTAGPKHGEKTTAAVINYLQKSDQAVFAFTSRGATERVRKITRRQFQSIGVDFSKSKIPESYRTIRVNVVSRTGINNFPIADGLMCTHGTSKEQFLLDFLLKCDPLPDRIVFIDDRLPDVQGVGETAKMFGIPYVGFHYSRLEKKLQTHDKMVTNVQLEKLLFEKVVVRGKEALDLAEKKMAEFSERNIPKDKIAVEYLREILKRISGDERLLNILKQKSLLI